MNYQPEDCWKCKAKFAIVDRLPKVKIECALCGYWPIIFTEVPEPELTELTLLEEEPELPTKVTKALRIGMLVTFAVLFFGCSVAFYGLFEGRPITGILAYGTVLLSSRIWDKFWRLYLYGIELERGE